MGIFATLMGGALGFAFGGPLGALMGVAAAAAASGAGRSRLRGAPVRGRVEEQQMAFLVAFIALAAKLSKADGQVTRDELAALKRVFPVPEAAAGQVGAIYNQARGDASGYEVYASQLTGIFGLRAPALENMIGALLVIANADGVYHPAERRFIADVAELFGYGAKDFQRIEGMFVHHEETVQSDDYAILGIEPAASDDEVKAAHRKFLKENHPDLAMARGLPEEFVELCNRKMAEANAAYDRIRHARSM